MTQPTVTRVKLSAVRRAIAQLPWAIQLEKLEAMIEVLEVHAAGATIDAERMEQLRAQMAAKEKTGLTRVQGAIAVLPLYGVISQRMNLMSEYSGGTSTELFGRDFDAAVANADIGAIVIDVDSPGGNVAGTPELAQKIFEARGTKPIIAIANSLMASAAYWIAAAADTLVATPSAEGIGSIGVYMLHEDDSQAYEEMGVKFTIIRAPEYKAEGNPYEQLSADALAFLQSKVDETYQMFEKAVAKYRDVKLEDVRQNYGRGRTLTAKQALDAGMIDRIATFDDVIAKLGGGKAPVAGRRADAVGPALAASDRPVLQIVGDVTDPRTAAALRAAVHALEPARGASGDSTALPAPVPTTGPKGQESPVDPKTTAAAEPGAAHIESVRLEAEKAMTKRSDDILTLCETHEIPLAQAKAFVGGGKSVDAVGREILEMKRAASKTPHITVGGDRAADRPWETFGHFANAVMSAYTPGSNTPTDPRLFGAATGMNQAVPSEGGFLVPPQFSTKIWDEMNNAPDNLLSLTDSYPVEGESITFNANAETSRATGSRYGGIKGYWINEADQITKSKPKFRAMRIEPHELAVLVYVTDKNLRNSTVALQTYLQRASSDEINFLAGDSIVRGSGAGQPLGILTAGSTVTVNKETSQPAATLQQENISKMWARLHPRCRTNAVWLMNVDVEPQLDFLNTVVKNVAGSENVGGYANKVYDAEKGTLKGRPIKFVEYCETLGTKGDVILWAPGWYATGVRSGGLLEAMSIHVRFEYAETAFRFMFALDGQPWLADPLTPYKGTNTLTSQVVLQTR